MAREFYLVAVYDREMRGFWWDARVLGLTKPRAGLLWPFSEANHEASLVQW